jgi:hypothetical protein
MTIKQPTQPPVVLSTAQLNAGRSHQPKGGMCAACAWARRNCEGLKFEAMPVIGKDESNGAKIVRCTDYLSGNPEKKTDFLEAALGST